MNVELKSMPSFDIFSLHDRFKADGGTIHPARIEIFDEQGVSLGIASFVTATHPGTMITGYAIDNDRFSCEMNAIIDLYRRIYLDPVIQKEECAS